MYTYMNIIRTMTLKQILKSYFFGIGYLFLLAIIGLFVVSIYHNFNPIDTSEQSLLIISFIFIVVVMTGFILLLLKPFKTPIVFILIITPIFYSYKFIKYVEPHNMIMTESIEPIDTRTKIINLLQRANEYIWISTGLDSDFYNDANVKKAMVDAIEKVKKVRIIIDGNVDVKKTEVSWLFEITKELKEKIQIKQKEEVLHWLIVDGRHFRLEKPHPVGIVGEKNLFVCNVKPSTFPEIVKRDFEKWWNTAEEIKL